MYLTYADYAAMGGGAPEGAFTRLEAKARMQINRQTFGRLAGETPVRDAVKNCMYDLIAAMEAEEALGAAAAGREITGMSNDGVSLSFASHGGAKATAARYATIVRFWLAGETTACGVPLTYAGVEIV